MRWRRRSRPSSWSAPRRSRACARSSAPTPSGVTFADMAEVGVNPARIIPAWREFVDAHAGRGRRLRGIGEPIWAQRSPDELVECQRHEALLNLAFAGAEDFWLLCPYDVEALDPDVIAKAHHSHPAVVADGGVARAARPTRTSTRSPPRSTEPLPEPPRRRRRAAVRLGHAGRRAPARQRCAPTAAGLRRRRAPATSCSPSTRWRPTRSATAAARGVAARLADRRRADLRGRRRGRASPIRSPGASGRPAASPAATACGCATRSATWSSCARSPAGSVVRLHTRLGP